nr:restriction endonuclease subunit S [uncultured Flavobacterium sp.]
MITATLYSEKERTLVPKLRFQQFDGCWKEILLEDFAKRGSGHTPNKSYPEYYNGEINWISLTDSKKLDNGYIEFTNTKLTQLGLDNSSAVLHPAGSVLLSRDAGVGKSAVMKHSMAVSQHFIVWSPKENVSSNWFLYNVLQILKPEFERIAIGNTIKTIGLPYFKKLKIIAPTFPEQQKIASFLSAVDEKIQQLSRKKELLSQYKKGVMQQLFSGKLRFKNENGEDYADWEEKKLGEIARITTGSSNRQDSNLDGDYTFFDRSQDIRSSNIFLFDTEAIIVPGEGQEFIPKYFIGKFDLHQRTYAVMDFGVNMGKFLFFYIGYHSNHLNSHAVGSTVKSLRLPMFEKMPIKLPSILEQQKIANFLSSIDTKIESTSQKINQIQSFKKGLLQQMFV